MCCMQNNQPPPKNLSGINDNSSAFEKVILEFVLSQACVFILDVDYERQKS